MNSITNNPDHALVIARRLIDDRIQTAQRRAQTHELRAARRAARRQSHTATSPAAVPTTSPATVPRARRTSFPNSVFGFLHSAR